ncbi:hypothetical protein MNAB215_4971 [Mycobacterium numidiamassiliense]|uniref:Uncharacterized protein n=1 Tax=Mycobacterium numidiamassiliense TaxID=1841861 RepID=A0A2U3PG77_9MYCO|nr:hypothetical protein [Mycobacterium numidiamassiliense]SPM42751.1 hypothetical protein MNAB215_4971 [Mycobacterium numidiamassiliense]
MKAPARNAAAAAGMVLVGASAIACGGGSTSSSTPSQPTTSQPTTSQPTTSKPVTSNVTGSSAASTSAPASPSDYTGLLINASDINAPEPFSATPPINNPNGQPCATTTFSNQDRTHVIADSIRILPDPGAAVSALESAKAARDGIVHGVPEKFAVGTGGTMISGPSPDATKGVTLVLFTEGKAFVELEFDGPPDALVPPDFVTDVAQKQDAAIKKGPTR